MYFTFVVISFYYFCRFFFGSICTQLLSVQNLETDVYGIVQFTGALQNNHVYRTVRDTSVSKFMHGICVLALFCFWIDFSVVYLR